MGGREAKDFIQFMEDPHEGPPPPPPEPEWKDLPSRVNHLTDNNFDEFLKKHDSVLVMFYAPCKLVVFVWLIWVWIFFILSGLIF